MKWRVVMEVTGADGAVGVHEIGGGVRIDEYSAPERRADAGRGKLLARRIAAPSRSGTDGDDHCRRRRRCQRCGTPRPIKRQAVPTSCVFVRVPRHECFQAPRFEAMPLRFVARPEP